MTYIKYSSGVVREWDETITVGTLIRTYNDGYHILENIEFPDPKPRNPALLGTVFDVWPIEFSDPSIQAEPIFHYVKVLKGDGTKSKAIRGSCAAGYCSRVTEKEAMDQLATEILAAHDKYAALYQFLKP